jgi:hypothetical protein
MDSKPNTNPTQLESAQMDSPIQTQHNLNRLKWTSYDPYIVICSFFQTCKNLMTVQFVQCHVEDDCTGRLVVQLMWQVD